MKLSYFLFGAVILIAFSLPAVSIYLLSQFQTGDFVYQKDTGEIGEIKGVSLPASYLVQWQDGSLEKESFVNIGKLSDLSDFEITETFQKEAGQDYSFYAGKIEGGGIVFEDTADTADVFGDTLPGGGSILGGKGSFNVIIGEVK